MEGGKVSDGGTSFECDRSSLADAPPGTNVSAGSAPGQDDANPTPAQASSRNPSRNSSRRNKKVYKQIDLATFQSPAPAPAPAARQPTVTPAEFRSQTNGMPPMAIRNSEYAPVTGQGLNMHKTFGNMFQSMAAQPRPKNFRKNEFAMKDDEFPSLK